VAIMGIGHLAVVVSDMRRSTEFYSGILGFEKVFEIPDDKGNPWICYFKIGKGTKSAEYGGAAKSAEYGAAKSAEYGGAQFIELFYPQKEAAPDAIARIGFSHMCFLVDDMKRTETEIVERGATLDKPIKLGKDGNFQCWLKDPDGNRIELMQIMPESPHAKSSK
jgi:catechol 2,3-dioxygenase-like lactoylglutathione lyase family enzyme